MCSTSTRSFPGWPGCFPPPAVHPAYGFWKRSRFAAVALYPSFHRYRLTSHPALAMARKLAAAGTFPGRVPPWIR